MQRTHVDVTELAGESGNCMPMVRVTPGYFETMGIKVDGHRPYVASVEAQHRADVVSDRVRQTLLGGTRARSDTSSSRSTRRGPSPSSPSPKTCTVERSSESAVEASLLPDRSPRRPPADWNGRGDARREGAQREHLGARYLKSARSSRRSNPKAIVADVQPMELVVAKSMAQTSFTMLLLLIAAAIALGAERGRHLRRDLVRRRPAAAPRSEFAWRSARSSGR